MIKLRQLLSEIYIDGYTSSDEKQGFRRPENFDDYAEGKGWVAYRGGNDWENGTTACAVYFGTGQDHARIWFTVKFPRGVKSDSDCPSKVADIAKKWGEQASKKWLTAARKIHSKPKEYFKDGSPWYKEWKQCFIEATKSRDMKKYVKDWGVDHTKWHAMKKTSPEPTKTDKLPVNEGTAAPGALEGWLDPSGTCHYVADTHAEWIARKLGVQAPNSSDVGAYEEQRMNLMKQLYAKGWVRIVIKHDINLIYFDTYNTPWKSLSRSQRQWLYDASIHGVSIKGDKIVTNAIDHFRETPYKIQFGGQKGNEFIEPTDIQ